jgi:hypothetical protein
MMFTSSAQGSTPGVPGAHTASLASEQADSISAPMPCRWFLGFAERQAPRRYRMVVLG